MDQHEILRYVAETLDRLNIPYFVTGSFASVLYGEARMTADIDVVVDLRMELLDELLRAFPEDKFYVDRDAAIDAVKTRFQFNVVDRGSVTKVDFIISPGSSHDREVFRRVKKLESQIKYEVAYASPEDIILKKLLFHKESGSPKHLRDVAGILKKSGAQLDWKYLEDWTDWLDVRTSWREARSLAGIEK